MRLLILLVMIVCSVSANANNHEPLFESCLALKNDVQSASAMQCRYFIKGFMAASYLTGVPSDSQLDKNTSDFFQRAFTSRMGKTSLDKRKQDCEVPTNQALIINHAAKKMPDHFDELFDLKLVIIKALRENQSCDSQK